MKELLITSLLFLIVGCWEYAEPEDYYLPESFEGPVVILFNQENGQEQKYVNGRRQYYIPENGVLYTSFPRVKGILDRNFYRSTDSLNQIVSGVIIEVKSPDQFYIDNGQSGSFSNLNPYIKHYNVSTDTIPTVDFKTFTIGRGKLPIDSLREAA